MKGSYRSHILLTAMDMIGAKGVDAVSARSILAAAGVKNTGAVQYYFGSMPNLLSAILVFIMDHVQKELARHAGELLLVPHPRPKQVLQAVLSPWLELPSLRPWGASALSFLAQACTSSSSQLSSLRSTHQSMLTKLLYRERWVPVLTERCFPDVPPEVLHFRLKLAFLGLLRSSATNHGLRLYGNWELKANALTVSQVIDFITAGIASPCLNTSISTPFYAGGPDNRQRARRSS